MSARDTLADMRAIGMMLMDEFEYAGPQWGVGYQMNLCALSIANALTDPTWDSTAVLHARALAHNAKLFIKDAE
jgi:hypothetical protein